MENPREVENPDQDREAWSVRLGIIPGWLDRNLKVFVKRLQWDLDWEGPGDLLSQALPEGCQWLDYWGTIQEKDVFVAEPYQFNSKTASDLDFFCSRVQATWFLSPQAERSSCFRIVICPR